MSYVLRPKPGTRRTALGTLLACLPLAVWGWTSPLAAPAASPPALPTCGNSYYGGKVKPRSWSSGCLGGSFNTERLRWSRWSGSVATGSGTQRFNDCEPSCAGGTVDNYRVTLRLSRVRICFTETSRRRMFTRVRFTSRAPGTRSGTFSLLCATEPF